MSDKVKGNMREFIAYKRTKNSNWAYEEYSALNDRAIDEIAPDDGNYCKIRLRQVDPKYDEANQYLNSANKSAKYVRMCLMLIETVEFYKDEDEWANRGEESPNTRPAQEALTKLGEMGDG